MRGAAICHLRAQA